MKKKVITALLITMTLTLGTVGTVFAMDNDVASVETGNDVNMIKEGFIWVVDKEAVYKTVHHEAEYKTIHHEAEYKTVHHEAEGYYEKQQVQVGTKPIYEKQEHAICNTCGGIDIGPRLDPVEGGLSKEYAEHLQYHTEQGEMKLQIDYKMVDVQIGEEPIYEEKEVWIETKPAWDEQILIREAYDEEILVKEAWDETILVSPEEGHWEPVKDDETKPENPDEEKPENPDQKPDEETPEIPEQKPDEETPENPEQKPDAEKPETPEQKPEEQKKPEQEPEKEDTNTAPKTGDPTSLAYLATLAGSALVGGGVLGWKSRKRK